MGDRRRSWKCENCGEILGLLLLRDQGYAQLTAFPRALERIVEEGDETRYTCARCNAERSWWRVPQQDVG